MCGKMGNTETDSMKNMMAISVYYIIADALELDALEITPENKLEEDLKMTANSKKELSELVSDMFDKQQLDFTQIESVQDVIDQVVTIH